MGVMLLVVIDLAMFGLILFIGTLLPGPVTWLLSLGWAVWVVWSSWRQLLAMSDLPSRLARVGAGHKGLFHKESESLLRAWGSVEAKASFFEGQPDSIVHAYDLIRRRVISDMESALRYIETYDYASRPDPGILRDFVRDGSDMVIKLNRLSDYVFRIDESPGDVDVSGLDDLLQALEEISE